MAASNMMFEGKIELAPNEIGTPLEDTMCAPGPQERIDSCAIRSQQHVLSMYGIDISESELVKDAVAHNEYSLTNGIGTYLDDVGNLLERNGIETQRYERATIAHLISELGQGHKIIIGVDAYEMTAHSLEDRIAEIQKDAVVFTPNHAVVVVNVDPNTFEVDIVDPLDGKLHRVSAETFIDAWEDSNCFMVSTTKSPEEYMASITETTNCVSQMNIYNGGNSMNNMQMYGIDANGDGIADVTIQSGSGIVNMSAEASLGGLGHVSGMVANGNEASLGGLGHVGGADGFDNIEMSGMDLNGDGIVDIVTIDITNDGIPDMVGIDINGDGIIDKIMDINDL